jgi:hypothetical protein
VAHPLRASELVEAGKATEPVAGKVRGVFFGAGDPSKAVKELFDKPDVARKELRDLAKSVKLKPRKAEKGVQPDGRIALVWWDTKAKKARRSTAAKDNTFKPATDRLVAALAVLDNKALRAGKWVEWKDVPSLPLPRAWTEDLERNGLADRATQVPAIGRAFSKPGPVSAGAFTAEWLGIDWPRVDADDRVAEWVMKQNAKKEYVNEKDRVVVLIVYQYAKAGDRSPRASRFYAISASGKLEAQLSISHSPAGGFNNVETSHKFKGD